MKHRLLILGSLDEFVDLVKKAKERGYYVVVCDGYEFGPAKQYADVKYDIHVNNVDEIAQLCQKERIDGIIGSFSDLLFERITEIADRAGLKWYLKPDALRFYRDKASAKKLMSDLGIRTSRSVELSHDFTDDQLDGLAFPLVIKPSKGYGTKSIYVVRSIEEIRNRSEEVSQRFEGGRIIAEEYNTGHEFNMMTWLIDGRMHLISIADRDRNPQSGDSVATLNRVVYPAKNIKEVYEEACSILMKYARATGQTNGPLSMQFFCDSQGVSVCEIAGRLFGYEHELVTYCCGFDISDMLLDYVYNEDRLKKNLEAHDPFFEKTSAGLYFHAQHGKTVGDMSKVRVLLEDPHVLEEIMFYQEGDTVDNYSSKPYFLRCYISADSRDELDDVTDRFFSTIGVTSDDGEEILIKPDIERY